MWQPVSQEAVKKGAQQGKYDYHKDGEVSRPYQGEHWSGAGPGQSPAKPKNNTPVHVAAKASILVSENNGFAVKRL